MFKLGTKSLNNLEGVHPILAALVQHAITISDQDFGVYEGLRTIERQRKLVASGASKTLRSMHLKQVDCYGSGNEYGHAVDLVPWIDGQFRWEWGPCYRIAVAVDAAATALGHADKVCWGGVWDKWMANYGGDMARAVKDYTVRHSGPDFIDGPHYQVGRLG